MILCFLFVPQFVLSHKAFIGAITAVSDNFGRPNGRLGPDWTDISDGGMAISSDAVTGAGGKKLTGEMWTADTFTGDQYSQIELTSTRLTGRQWIGSAVRVQSSGQSAYVGIYCWNSGSPELELLERTSGSWEQISSAYRTGPLAAGTQLELMAIGSTISFLENGNTIISVSDSTLTGGAPGIMAYGNARASHWSGGDAVTHSIGGTVSGLSGTVVLQDNGGDNLSVSSNGSFTFATAVIKGGSYDVTVETYPSGRTCTVSNGSGTVAFANVTGVIVSCTTNPMATSGFDSFGRPNGRLGPDWTDISDGGMAISSDAVTGAGGKKLTGEMWTADTFTGDQYSQIELTSTRLTGRQWIGSAVRVQSSGQSAYVGIYCWNSGSPELELLERTSGSWEQISSAYRTGPLAAGTQLELMAIGSTISFLENGNTIISVSDSTLTGGAPGIMAYGNARASDWSGGDESSFGYASIPRFQATYMSTDSNGIESYQVISSDNGYGPQTLRVLRPTDPAPGIPHNFLYVLPVENGLGTIYGDGLETLLALNAQNRYNLTIIEPTFGTDPWYANNPSDPNVQYETFMTQDLVPWVKKNLSITGNEQNWLIGFSKSGLGAQDLILKHPDIFTLAASWDFPADMSTYNLFGTDSVAGYGTDANFQANYRLTAAFINTHKGPFLSSNRIWIGGYSEYQTGISEYGALLTAERMVHSAEMPQYMAHRWDSGWVSIALAALHQDSIHLPASP